MLSNVRLGFSLTIQSEAVGSAILVLTSGGPTVDAFVVGPFVAELGELDQFRRHRLASLPLCGVIGVTRDLDDRVGRLHEIGLRGLVVAVFEIGEALIFKTFEGVV